MYDKESPAGLASQVPGGQTITPAYTIYAGVNEYMMHTSYQRWNNIIDISYTMTLP